MALLGQSHKLQQMYTTQLYGVSTFISNRLSAPQNKTKKVLLGQ